MEKSKYTAKSIQLFDLHTEPDNDQRQHASRSGLAVARDGRRQRPHLTANGGTTEGSPEERAATEGKGRGRATGCTSVRRHKRPGE